MIELRAIVRTAAFLLFLVASGVAGADNPTTASARQVWQMLDYIAVDYAEAVRDGEIVNDGEFAEMQEFSASVQDQLQRLPASPSHSHLVTAAADLQEAISRLEAPSLVAKRSRALAEDVLDAYALGAAPMSMPDPDAVVEIYANRCGGCHGALGAGDGPIGANLDPPPIAFTDHTRAAQRSPYALYQAVSQGISGTSMAAFADLSDAERWSLAFHVGRMAYSGDDVAMGARLWGDSKQRRAIADLAVLSSSSEAQLAEQVGRDTARALTAYLRTHPSAVAETTTADDRSLVLAGSLLQDSVDAYAKGDAQEARRLALAAYLDGVEPVEPMLAARDPALLGELEAVMAVLREKISTQAAIAEVNAQHRIVQGVMERADARLDASQGTGVAAFVGSFTILLREGLEALLIVIGMIAFLRKAERKDALPYVHAGWIGALVAGALTWVVATYLIGISGANREITEGLSSLLAAVVLLSVGVWMHQKSLAGHWQAYLRQKMSAAMSRKSAVFLFLLAFIAVYREVFETILFFAAMWNDQSSGAIMFGLLAGSAALAIVAFWLLRISSRLPIAQFFRVSSMMIAILAIVLVGKGVAALQEAGWISESVLAAPRIEWLGIYPTWQVVMSQLLVAAAALIGFAANARARDPVKQSA